MPSYGLQDQLKARTATPHSEPAPATILVEAERGVESSTEVSSDPPLVTTPDPQAQRNLDDVGRRQFDNWCETLRAGQPTPDGMGGTTPGQPVLTRYPCALQSTINRAKETNLGAATMAQTDWFLHLPKWADVRATDRIAIPGWMNAWTPATPLEVGDYIIPTDADGGETIYFKAIQGGVTGANEPLWPGLQGETIADGTVAWRCMGVARFLEVTNDNAGEAHASELTVECKSLDM